MSALQSGFSLTAPQRASALFLPPRNPPTPPAHPAGLLVFCPAWPTFPQLSLGGGQPGPASSATRSPGLGRRGPNPACSCHWSQGDGWVGWGAAEELKNWTQPVRRPQKPVSRAPSFLLSRSLHSQVAAERCTGTQPRRLPFPLLMASSWFHIPGTSPVPFAPLTPLASPCPAPSSFFSFPSSSSPSL